MLFQSLMEKCDKSGRNSMCLTPTSKHDSDITKIQTVCFHYHTGVIKERCQTGGFRESNGRQVIISSCWQRGDRGLQAGPIGRGSKTPELPLSMQTTLHTVTKSTGPDRLPEKNTKQERRSATLYTLLQQNRLV